jgi:hypothetical protein
MKCCPLQEHLSLLMIAEKSPKRKDRKVAAGGETLERGESLGTSENPISAIKNFVCKYLC